MSEEQESSVLFSLKELMSIEEDRIQTETEEKQRQAEDEQRLQEEEERRRGVNHGPQRALHVGAATSIDGVINNDGAEGVVRPWHARRDAHRVGVSIEEQRATRHRAVDRAYDVADIVHVD